MFVCTQCVIMYSHVHLLMCTNSDGNVVVSGPEIIPERVSLQQVVARFWGRLGLNPDLCSGVPGDPVPSFLF